MSVCVRMCPGVCLDGYSAIHTPLTPYRIVSAQVLTARSNSWVSISGASITTRRFVVLLASTPVSATATRGGVVNGSGNLIVTRETVDLRCRCSNATQPDRYTD